eukprot:181481-Chlamydomonas_euryale.AAC.1
MQGHQLHSPAHTPCPHTCAMCGHQLQLQPARPLPRCAHERRLARSMRRRQRAAAAVLVDGAARKQQQCERPTAVPSAALGDARSDAA